MKNRYKIYYDNLRNKKILKIVVIFFILFILLYVVIYKRKNAFIKSKFITNLSQDALIFNKLDLTELNNQYLLLNVYKVESEENIFSFNIVNRLQDIYKNKIVIVDVIMDIDKFDSNVILNFILKNNITRPILNIKNFDEPKFVLIDKKGNIINTFKNDFKEIKKDIDSIIAKNKPILLNIQLEKDNLPESFIKSLSFIKIYNNNLIITDSKGKKIYITSLNGKIISIISDFCYPTNFSIKENFLYVPDTCNNVIKKIDLTNLEAKDAIKIQHPLAIKFLNDTAIIATSKGIYKDNEILCEECKNVFKLEKYNNKVYFINDDEIKYIDTDFNINNTGIIANNSNNLYVDNTGIYVADKFNNKIFKDGKIYSEDELYNMPTDITNYLDKLYIANENSHNILILDKVTKEIKTLNISFNKNFNETKSEEFLYIDNINEYETKSENVNVLINTEDYILSQFAPHSLSLFKENKITNTAILVKKYSRNEILNKNIKLPDLEDYNYYLKGSLFYYKNKGLLLIKNFTIKITPSRDNIENEIIINL
jgi:hypothetical protein